MALDVYGVLANLMCCDRFAGRLEDREEGETVSSDEETQKVRTMRVQGGKCGLSCVWWSGCGQTLG